MDNRYEATTHVAPEPPRAHRWQRTVLWAILIFLALNAVGIIAGISMGWWDIYGRTIEEAVVNARRVRLIAYGLVGAILYWRFAARIRSKRLLHVMMLYALVQTIELIFSFLVYRVPVDQLVDPWYVSRSFLAALIGLGLAIAKPSRWRSTP